MAHTRQSRPDSGLGFQVKALKPFKLFPVRSEAVPEVTEMCSGSEAGSHLRLIDFVYLSTLGLRVIKKKKVPEVDAELAELFVGLGRRLFES